MECPVCGLNPLPDGIDRCPNEQCAFLFRYPLTAEDCELHGKIIAAAREEYNLRSGATQAGSIFLDPASRLDTLKKDPFETTASWRARLAMRPVRVGRALLLSTEYEADQGTFPLQIEWHPECSQMLASCPPYLHALIRVIPEEAQRLHAEAVERDLYALADLEHGRLLVGDLMVAGLGRIFPVEVSPMGGDVIKDQTVGMELIWIPGAKFEIGDIYGDGYPNEKPVREVLLDSFFLGKFPVTQGQWQKVMKNNPSQFQKGDDYPVENVTYDDAAEFARRLSKATNWHFRLPTEAEWEYAARSTGERERYAGGDDIVRLAWFAKNSNGSTQPVGKLEPNGLGLHDMSGNVSEWCFDFFDPDYYKKMPRHNPVGPSYGKSHVIRGGCWQDDERRVRTMFRSEGGSGFHSGIGLRVALSLGQNKKSPTL